MQNKRRGFTLIELLVSVLIIAVLAAVAVPQYQKAVRKAKLAEIGVFFSTVSKALDLWVLENGMSDGDFYRLDTTTSAVLPLDISCTPYYGGCNNELGYWSISCSKSQARCSITLQGFNSLSRSVTKSGDEVKWSNQPGRWVLDSVNLADTRLQKQICQWWKENYGAELMIGTSASDHCKD